MPAADHAPAGLTGRPADSAPCSPCCRVPVAATLARVWCPCCDRPVTAARLSGQVVTPA